MKHIYTLVLISLFTFPTYSQSWSEVIKSVASDRATGDNFGVSVSISGNKAIVGAFQEDHDATGGNTLSRAGSAYIFELIGGVWTQTAKLVASDREAGDRFGFSVFMSGNRVIIGAINEDNDLFGGVTKIDAGSAYIFEFSAGIWTQTAKLVASDREADDQFGTSVSIYNSRVIIGSTKDDHNVSGGGLETDAGSAYIFELISGVWTQTAKLISSDKSADDRFGRSVSISGTKVVIGAVQEDENASGGATLSASGSAYIFELISGVWTQTAKLVASDRTTDDNFGLSVSISGNRAIVGSHLQDKNLTGGTSLLNAGAAYIFELSGGVWTQTTKLIASDRAIGDNFGFPVQIDGNNVIIGARLNDFDASGNNQMNDPGAAYIFEFDGTTWNERSKLVASDRAGGDYYGYAVSIDGGNAMVGAHLEDHDTLGGAGMTDAGAVYFYKYNSHVSLSENDFGKNFKLYPNPIESNFSVDLGKTYENITVTITDITGKIIQSKEYNNSQLLNLKLDEPAGVYLLKIESKNKTSILRLIKK